MSDDSLATEVMERGGEAELLIEVHGPVRVVVMNRPRAFNASNEGLHRELALIWRELALNEDIRAIVLTGAGNAFSAGGDLGLLDRMAKDRSLRDAVIAEAAEIVQAMTTVRVPIITAVNGPAVGLGCSLASMSDIVLIEEQAYFSDPHVSLGLVAADGGALTWPLLTSLLRAKEFLLLGDRIKAPDAVAFGLANRVVPTGESRRAAIELAHRLATLPPQSVQETKALLNQGLHAAVASILPGALKAETASFDEPVFQANLARMLKRDG